MSSLELSKIGAPLGARRRVGATTHEAPEPEHRETEWEANDRLPRLQLRFAIYTAIGLAFATAAILIFVRGYATVQAENSVKYHAKFLSSITLGDRLDPEDFAGPVGDVRRAQLDLLFRRRVLIDGTLRATLLSPGGVVTYSTDTALIGKRAAGAGDLERSLSGDDVRSETTTIRTSQSERKVLRVSVPVRFRGEGLTGAFVLSQDYAPVSASAKHVFLPVAGVLELVLLALYLSLFPILGKVTDRMRNQMDEIEHQALHDGLTGLPNRRLFRDRVEQALARARRSDTEVAVLLIDLDRFKDVNDTLGHGAGDVVLQEVGDRLRSILRETDTLARLGGDEFGVVAPVERRGDAGKVVDRIAKALDKPVILDSLTVDVGGTAGVALFPDDGEDMDTLLKHADVAMYTAKETGAGHAYYAAEYDANDATKLSVTSELRKAIPDELEVHYQPQLSLETGRVEGVEALVRWRHPKRGLLMPGEFVPVASHSGVIKQLTAAVLNRALEQSAAWRVDGLDLRMAVNLDMRSLVDTRFPGQVRELLAIWRVPADRLVLEITEDMVMADPARAGEVAGELARIGVQLAIDDFGTGYSSFAQLERLPINELKIDRSFVMGLENERRAAIVRSLVDLGRSLELRVVAEGVETPSVVKSLVSYGCGYAQGFLFGRPAPADELTEVLRPSARLETSAGSPVRVRAPARVRPATS
jgi:diguanylate cyclase (GGDEF)-like protein